MGSSSSSADFEEERKGNPANELADNPAPADGTETDPKKKPATESAVKPKEAEEEKGDRAIQDNLFQAKNVAKAQASAVVDAVFLCDCTGSMSNFIKHAKATIKKMVEQIRAKYTESSIFVGFIGYRDHCVTMTKSFSSPST